jgi:hypothetical protein
MCKAAEGIPCLGVFPLRRIIVISIIKSFAEFNESVSIEIAFRDWEWIVWRPSMESARELIEELVVVSLVIIVPAPPIIVIACER